MEYDDEMRPKISCIEYDNLKKSQQEALKEVESSKIKGMIFANLAHDLKTPIAVIESAVQMLERDCDIYEGTDVKLSDDERKNNIKRHLGFIRSNSSSLIRMIKNISMMCRMDNGTYVLEKTKCNIVTIIEDKVMSMIPYAKHRDVEILFDTEEEEIDVECDVEKVEAIVQNLISNAIKYNVNKGSVDINVATLDDRVVISVKDTGIGIPEKDIDEVFGRYNRGSDAKDHSYEGSGIGLYLVKMITQMHGGEVGVTSELGRGTEFRVSLPLGNI